VAAGNNKNSGHEAARVLMAASDQIDLALQQSQPSVDALGEALRRLATMLAAAAKGGRNDALAAMRAEMLRAITSLQYHDRMTQHLSHVRDYLSGSAEQMAALDGRAEENWNGLHSRLRDRLLSETQRMHLGKIFPNGIVADDQPPPARAASKPGDIDLF
jgi:septal ring factor EnvC (AmiA/AmiB activator)